VIIVATFMGFGWLETCNCDKHHACGIRTARDSSSLDALAYRSEVRCRADTPASGGRCETELTIRKCTTQTTVGGTASEFPQSLSRHSLPPPPHHMICRYGSRMECTYAATVHANAPASLSSKASKREDDHTANHASSRRLKSENIFIDKVDFHSIDRLQY
jgi:hypothetical protein